MKIIIIGGGVSGITFAISRKRNHPNDDVLVIEHSDKLLKKVLATGNGKCNIANAGKIENIYNSKIAEKIINKYDFNFQNAFIESLNVKTKLIGDLSYPISESAVTIRNAFLKEIERLKIKVLYNCNVIDYLFKDNKYNIITDQGEYIADKIVFAVGGKSLAKSGSDGSIIPLLEKHLYQLKEFYPALCPIYTLEKTKLLDGTRVKSQVKVKENNNEIFIENGEVLFKEHGLSGIVIFNASRLIAHRKNKKYQIELDLLPDIQINELKEFLTNHSKEELLERYLHPNLVKYLLDLKGDVIKNIKSLTFSYDKSYSFDNSQISVGGISLKEISEELESKKEKGIYFIGELLDIDAPCGGYNLMWAIGSALYTSDII